MRAWWGQSTTSSASCEPGVGRTSQDQRGVGRRMGVVEDHAETIEAVR